MTHDDRIAAWRREVDARPPLSRGPGVSISYLSRGLACELAREEGEPWRGYVRLPAGHPWIGAEEAGDLLLDVGGQAGREITWSGPRADHGDAWWIGFDGVPLASSARRIIADLARIARMANMTDETDAVTCSDEGAAIKAALGELAVEVVWGTQRVTPTKQRRGWHVRLRGLRGWRYLGEEFTRAMEIARNIKEAGGRL